MKEKIEKFHTAMDASDKKGKYKCPKCSEVINMWGNYKDRFPPCPKCKSGIDWIKLKVSS